jgi:hypothetical protein
VIGKVRSKSFDEPQRGLGGGKTMKKVMMVMTILEALLFLISLIAIAPSLAAQATNTPSTTTQHGTVQTPAQQKINKPANLNLTAYEKAKEKFWGLEFDHCIIGGTDTRGKDAWNLNIPGGKVGQPLTCTCFYKVKTPLIKDITEADTKVWGKGKSYYVLTAFTQVNVPEEIYFSKGENRDLPHFTWEDVKRWRKGGGNAPRIWTEHMVFTWTPTHDRAELWFDVDQNKVIPEYDGDDNNNGIFRTFFPHP